MDKFDEAVEYFNKHPEEIYLCWNNPSDYLHGCLFESLWHPSLFGSHVCPTQLKRAMNSVTDVFRSSVSYYSPDIIEAVLVRDIPMEGKDIQVKHLTLFAEVQRISNNLKIVSAQKTE